MLRLTSKQISSRRVIYIVAIVATIVATLIRQGVGDLAGRGPLGPFFLAVLLSGWLGGWGPGVLATILCTVVMAGFFVERTGLVFHDIGDGIAVSLFVVVGFLTSWICEVTHRRGRRLKLQDRLLQESEERYRLLTEAQPGMVWTLRRDHTVDFVNSAWETFTGKTLDQLGAEGWRDLIHPDDRTAMLAAIVAPLERGEPHEVNIRFRRYDGVYRRVLSRVVPLKDAAGTVVKWIGTTTDVHDLWLARENLRESTVKLQESERRFSSVASAPVLIWSAGLDKRCDWVNDLWLDFTGRTMEQELGDGWLEGVHSEDRARAFDTYVRAFDARQPFSREYRLRNRNGEYRQIVDEGVPRMVDGTFQGFIGSAVDVTDQRLLEERILQAKKMDAVGQLAGGVAHDLNNLLTIINGYTDLMLARVSAGDPTRHELEEVRIAGERAASLTNQLLAFGRRQARQPTRLDISAAVEESAAASRRLLGSDVDVIVTSDGRPAHARVDPNQLAQVLLNLAINAREAMPSGGKLTYAIGVVEPGNSDGRHPHLPSGEYVRIAVTDTGRGMTPEIRARVFEPFFTTKGFGKGSGLGLAVVHGIIQQSGGFIDVSSEPGQGTTFVLHFPRVADDGSSGDAASR